ncbi:two-component system, sensor histidine kinase and response regulator [Anaerolineae bacterium]|nr:two-component system, sensor histidine kinase and response regulator [Anaerolineae bacterium]
MLKDADEAQKSDRLFTLLQDLACTASLDRRLQTLNPAWERILGYSDDSLKGKTLTDYIHPDDFQATLSELNKLRIPEQSVSFENRFRCHDGTYKLLSWNTTLVAENGPLFLMARDITSANQAEQELRRRAVGLETVAKVSAATARILEVDPLLQTVAELTKESFNLYHAHVYLLNETGEQLVLAAGAGEPGRLMKARGHQIALSNPRSLVARAARTRQGVVENDVTAAEDFLPNPMLPKTRSEMAVPMVVGETLIGVLDVQSDVINRFTPADVQIQTALSDQIAVAVQNARALGQAERSRQLLRAVIDTTPDWIFVKDNNFRYLLVNQAFAYEYGHLTPDQMVGKDDYDLGTPAELIEGNPEKGIRGFRTDDREVLSGNEIFNPYDVVPAHGGGVNVFETRKLPLRNVEGKIEGVLGYGRDVTKRHEAEQELRKRAAELETVAKVSAATARILEVDPLLQIVAELTKESFNLYHAHVYLLNETGEQLVLAAGAGEPGRLMKARGHQIALSNPRSLVARAARTRQGVVENDVTAAEDFLPNPMLPKTRSEMAVPMVVGETLIGVLDVQSDVINRFTPADVQIQTALSDQIAVAVQNASLYAKQVEVAEQFRTVDRLKSEFLANMSHELRTPLNSIIGFAEVLADGIDGDLPEEALEDVNAIHDSGQHLLSMINDILDLAKIEAGRMELDLVSVPLTSIADEVRRLTSVLFKEKPVDLTISIPDSLPALWADKVRLRQILNNLVSNASKFTHEGEVRIEARLLEHKDAVARQRDAQGDMVLISVQDTGEGIAKENLNLIFEQFRQADSSSTRKAGGTGMGLAITRHLVRLHGGEIWVESEPNKGSTFSFLIPVASSQ